VALAIAVPMAIVALQGSHDLKFEYVKSGGLAGLNRKLVFDSQTNAITAYLTPGTNGSKHLSDAQVEEIRHAVAGSGFFAMDNIQPKTGPADYFSYSLTVTMEGASHSVSWVDDFAASQPVPEDLKNIANKIEEAFSNASI
jgi:hypothetical protein